MATHLNIPVWEIPLTEETSWYSSQGHEESDMTEHVCIFTVLHLRSLVFIF